MYNFLAFFFEQVSCLKVSFLVIQIWRTQKIDLNFKILLCYWSTSNFEWIFLHTDVTKKVTSKQETFLLMSGSCHLDRASNDEFSVECL